MVGKNYALASTIDSSTFSSVPEPHSVSAGVGSFEFESGSLDYVLVLAVWSLVKVNSAGGYG